MQRLIPNSVQLSSIHQQTLSQTDDVAAPATLAKDRLPYDTQVAHVVATACWQRPRGCSCRCHISHERPWHSAILGTVGLTSLFDRCNRGDTCDTRRYAAYARFALNHFGVPLAICLAAELKIYGGFVPVLYPTVEVQRVCDFTCPGFKVLGELADGSFGIDFKLDGDKATALREAAKAGKIAELKRLFASGEVSPLDIDPDGHTWLEVALQANPCVWTVLTASRNFFDLLGHSIGGRHSSSSLSFWRSAVQKTFRAIRGSYESILEQVSTANRFCRTLAYLRKFSAGLAKVHTCLH
jgi:hypothetical protein